MSYNFYVFHTTQFYIKGDDGGHELENQPLEENVVDTNLIDACSWAIKWVEHMKTKLCDWNI